MSVMHSLRHDPARREDVLFVLASMVCLVPVWGLTHFPSADGPSHVYNALALHHWLLGTCEVVRETYQLNPIPVPNLLTQVIMTALMAVLPVITAEKVWLTAYVLLLPLSARYAAVAMGPRGRAASWLVLPYVLGLPLVAGWYNFAAGLVVFFLTFGYWLRQPVPAPPRTRRRFTALFLLLYFSHPFALAAALLCIASTGTWHAWLEARERPATEGRPSVRLLARLTWPRVGAPMLRALPALALLAVYAVANHVFAGDAGAPQLGRSWRALLQVLFMNQPMGALARGEIALAAGYGAFLWILLGLSLSGPDAAAPERRRAWGVLAAGAAVLVLILALPDRALGGGNLVRRLDLLLMLVIVLWLGAQRGGRAFAIVLRLVPVAVTLLQVGLRMPVYREIDAHYADLRTAAAPVPAGGRFLSIAFDWTVSPVPEVPPILLRNGVGYLAADRCLVDLSNYEGLLIYFPLLYRRDNQLFYRVDAAVLPEVLDQARPPDWVLVHGVTQRLGARAKGHADRIVAQLEARYDLAHTHARGEWSASLYRRRQ